MCVVSTKCIYKIELRTLTRGKYLCSGAPPAQSKKRFPRRREKFASPMFPEYKWCGDDERWMKCIVAQLCQLQGVSVADNQSLSLFQPSPWVSLCGRLWQSRWSATSPSADLFNLASGRRVSTHTKWSPMCGWRPWRSTRPFWLCLGCKQPGTKVPNRFSTNFLVV